MATSNWRFDAALALMAFQASALMPWPPAMAALATVGAFFVFLACFDALLPWTKTTDKEQDDGP